MFDHCHCQNIHSHSQNRCFKKMTKYRRKKGPVAWGRGVEKLFRQNLFEQHLSFQGASLRSLGWVSLHVSLLLYVAFYILWGKRAEISGTVCLVCLNISCFISSLCLVLCWEKLSLHKKAKVANPFHFLLFPLYQDGLWRKISNG